MELAPGRVGEPLGAAAHRPDRAAWWRFVIDRNADATAVDAVPLLRTDAAWSEATVDFPATRRLVDAALGALPEALLPVATGFIGGTELGATTLLGGRGGATA